MSGSWTTERVRIAVPVALSLSNALGNRARTAASASGEAPEFAGRYSIRPSVRAIDAIPE